jgi:hypothetical protein
MKVMVMVVWAAYQGLAAKEGLGGDELRPRRRLGLLRELHLVVCCGIVEK